MGGRYLREMLEVTVAVSGDLPSIGTSGQESDRRGSALQARVQAVGVPPARYDHRGYACLLSSWLGTTLERCPNPASFTALTLIEAD